MVPFDKLTVHIRPLTDSNTFVKPNHVVDCGNLDDPDNGEVTLTGTTLGSKADYSCNNGYALEGNERRVCQSNREWSGMAPVCRRMLILCL